MSRDRLPAWLRAMNVTPHDRAIAIVDALGLIGEAVTLAHVCVDGLVGDDDDHVDGGRALAAEIRRRRTAGYLVDAPLIHRACGVSCARDLRRYCPAVATALTDHVPTTTPTASVPPPSGSWPGRGGES